MFFFSEVDFIVREVLLCECGFKSDNDFTHDVLSVNVSLFREHED